MDIEEILGFQPDLIFFRCACPCTPLILVSTLLFQPQTADPQKQYTPIEPLARGRLWVDSWSIFGQFRSKLTKADQEPTENRLKTDPLQGPDRRLPLRRGEGLWLR